MEEQNKPTYEQLEQAVNQLYQENQNLKQRIANADRDNMIVDRIKVLLEVVDRKDTLSKSTISLAEWHLKNMLAKPKETNE